MFKEVKILCMVMTHPANHRTKAIHVKNTWGKYCNKLIFMSTIRDVDLESVALPVRDGREFLWNKTKNAFKYVFDNHYNDADWFIKADDDTYMIPENIRFMLYQYRATTSLYFGHRFCHWKNPSGYIQGGAYILSKKALEKFVTKLMNNESYCKLGPEGDEDVEIGKCFRHTAISVDERDEKHQKRFFHVGIADHVKKEKDLGYWYDVSQYFEVAQGSLDCCSDLPVSYHYATPQELYFLDYLIRHVHPFGLEKSQTQKLPRKYSLDEIIKASDADSSAANFESYSINHELEDSEKY
ncbi:CLUMA_CG013153, isoform A [Clunio marinus]|uniref:N-acetylgalactosaminide beta-1,3-galactosyltransferase n=1 Tax=Clunio marinus TaxID=568069 RepID=A0A1J1IJA9_9DIPT|nr:CLUMA_CG013153, isoform A [Clunio marinus]